MFRSQIFLLTDQISTLSEQSDLYRRDINIKTLNNWSLLIFVLHAVTIVWVHNKVLQSRNPDPKRRVIPRVIFGIPPSRADFQSRISPRFRFLVPNPQRGNPVSRKSYEDPPSLAMVHVIVP